MKAIRQKLNSQNGASITYALLLFLVCAVVGSIVLTAGTASAGRFSGLSENDQQYYSVTSAAELFGTQYFHFPDGSRDVQITLQRSRQMQKITTTTITYLDLDRDGTIDVDEDGNQLYNETTTFSTVQGNWNYSPMEIDGSARNAVSAILPGLAKELVEEIPVTGTSLEKQMWESWDSDAIDDIHIPISFPDEKQLTISVKNSNNGKEYPDADVGIIISTKAGERESDPALWTFSFSDDIEAADPSAGNDSSRKANPFAVAMSISLQRREGNIVPVESAHSWSTPTTSGNTTTETETWTVTQSRTMTLTWTAKEIYVKSGAAA